MTLELNKIYCMDALDGMKQLEDKSVDLVVTDPPYGINYQSRQKKEKFDRFVNDDNLDFLEPTFSEINRVLKDNTHIYVFTPYKNIDIFVSQFKKYFSLKNILVFKTRHSGGVINEGHFRHACEYVIFGHKGKRGFNSLNKHRVVRPQDKRQKNRYLHLYPDLNDFYYANEFNLKQEHPTQKDIDCIRFMVGLSSNPSELVLDPFMGSGTTAVASKSLNRKFIGFEISPEYCRIAEKRLEQKTLSEWGLLKANSVI